MAVIRIHKHIDSETLHLPELKPLFGQTVEIVILDEEASRWMGTETRETFFALAPKDEKPLTPEEIKAMLADPQYKDLWPLLEVAGEDIIDVDAIIALRAASM